MRRSKSVLTICSVLLLLVCGCRYDKSHFKRLSSDNGNNKTVIYITRKGTTIMARVNTNFCKPSEDGKSLVYAPVAFPPNMGEPSDEDYLKRGWYYNSVQPPEPPDGKQVASVSYKVEDDEVVAEYTYEDMPPPIRTFSKLKLYGALVQAGLWDSLVNWLQGQSIDGVNAYTAFTLAQDLSDAHPLFDQWLLQIKTDLGISDELIETILAASEAD